MKNGKRTTSVSYTHLDVYKRQVKGKDEDPAQRIPYTITNKLTKACFAEYDSSFTENGTGKTAWLDGQRSLIDAEKQDVLQWVMVRCV